MKITCSQKILKSNLSIVCQAVPDRPTQPILLNILITASEQKLTFTAFDLSVGIRTSFDADVHKPEVLCIPAKLTNDIVSQLPDGDVEMELEKNTEDVAYLIIRSKSGKYKVRVITGADFPELPVVKSPIFKIPPKLCSEALNATLFAASKEESRPVMMGASLIFEDGYIEIAATDGRRLALMKFPCKGKSLSSTQLVIPAKSLLQLEKILRSYSEDSLSLQVDDYQAVFSIADGRCVLTTRILDGQYPSYRDLVPVVFDKQILCDRKLLLTALERTTVCADNLHKTLQLETNKLGQEIILSCETEHGKGREVIPADVTGEDIALGFNYEFLKDGLKAFVSSNVQIHANEPLQPVVLTNAEESDKQKYLIMPLRLRA